MKTTGTQVCSQACFLKEHCCKGLVIIDSENDYLLLVNLVLVHTRKKEEIHDMRSMGCGFKI